MLGNSWLFLALSATASFTSGTRNLALLALLVLRDNYQDFSGRI